MVRLAIATAVYAALWLLWSGHYAALPVAFGAASVILTVTLSHRLKVLDREGFPVSVFIRTIAFVPWLLYQVLRANLIVVKMIVSPRLKLAPQIVSVISTQRTEVGKAIHANAITLTPGTISLDVRGQRILVHALDQKTAADPADRELNRRVDFLEAKLADALDSSPDADGVNTQ